MLVLNIERLVKMRGVRHPRTFLINHGYSEGEARWLLYGKRKSVQMSLLGRLGETFQCTLDELFDWQGDPNHPLAVLRKDKAPDIFRLLADKSPEELEAIFKMISEG